MQTIDGIRTAVSGAVERYNRGAAADRAIKRMELFGSYAAGTQHEGSDVDLLVEFSSENVSLFTLATVLDYMEEAIKSEVDLVQLPLPVDTLLEIERTVPLYEAA